MGRWLYRRRWAVMSTFAAYGLMRSVLALWPVPLPQAAEDMLGLAVMLGFCALLRSVRLYEPEQPNTPLDTRRGT